MKRGSTLKLSSSLTRDSVGQMQKSIKIAQRESTQQRNNNKRNSFKQAISIRSPKTSSKGSPKRETKKVNFGQHVVRVFQQDGTAVDYTYETNDLKEKIENMKNHYLPDFGYTDQIDFSDGKSPHGWKFFLDLISKYRQREKISNTITNLKQEKQDHISHKSMTNESFMNKKQTIEFKNTPKENWLLWHHQRGKEESKMMPIEHRLRKIKDDLERVKIIAGQGNNWLESYKQAISPQKPRKSVQPSNVAFQEFQIDIGKQSHKKLSTDVVLHSKSNKESLAQHLKRHSRVSEQNSPKMNKIPYFFRRSSIANQMTPKFDPSSFSFPKKNWFTHKGGKKRNLNSPSMSMRHHSQQNQQLLDFVFQCYKQLGCQSDQFHPHNAKQMLNNIESQIGDELEIDSKKKVIIMKNILKQLSSNEASKIKLSHIDCFKSEPFYDELSQKLRDVMNADLYSANEQIEIVNFDDYPLPASTKHESSNNLFTRFNRAKLVHQRSSIQSQVSIRKPRNELAISKLPQYRYNDKMRGLQSIIKSNNFSCQSSPRELFFEERQNQKLGSARIVEMASQDYQGQVSQKYKNRIIKIYKQPFKALDKIPNYASLIDQDMKPRLNNRLRMKTKMPRMSQSIEIGQKFSNIFLNSFVKKADFDDQSIITDENNEYTS